MRWNRSAPSRVAAAFISPGRKPGVADEKGNESRRDGTALDTTNYDNVPSTGSPTHVHLLTGMDINAELIRSRLARKPAHSVSFETKTAWAG